MRLADLFGLPKKHTIGKALKPVDYTGLKNTMPLRGDKVEYRIAFTVILSNGDSVTSHYHGDGAENAQRLFEVYVGLTAKMEAPYLLQLYSFWRKQTRETGRVENEAFKNHLKSKNH